MTPDQITEIIEEKKDTISRTSRRYTKLFLDLPDSRAALVKKVS
jgi:hypothetical protein